MRDGDPNRLGAATTIWLTAADISRLWGMAPGSVYRLANEGNWRRQRRGRKMYYHAGDVQRACDTKRSPTQ
ncbi:hypothetical protein H3T12_21670 [Streptomyces sp. GMR22]|nr:hypothetical protein [Streptomyces sp. GMR22]